MTDKHQTNQHVAEEAMAVMLMEHRHLEREQAQYEEGLQAKNPEPCRLS